MDIPSSELNPRAGFRPRARVLVYRETTNIGDAIQTFAMARLLGEPCLGVYRDVPAPDLHNELPFVVNGWFGHRPPLNQSNCIFAGVHLGNAEPEHVAWFRQSGLQVGARDSYTRGLLSSNRVPAEMIGCATLTLPRYRGPRSGRYSIDIDPIPGTKFESQLIPDLPWVDQWELALSRLDQLRKAEVVYSGRIHAILPCLAFGTPVVFPFSAIRDAFDKSRLSLLHDLGFVYDEPVEMDVTGIAERFIAFLERELNAPIRPVDQPPMPVPAIRADVEPPSGARAPSNRPWRSWDIPRPASCRPAPSVTALVISRNGPEALSRCLESIRAAGFVRDLVVTFTQPATDAAVDAARRYTEHLHFVEVGREDVSIEDLAPLCPGEYILRLDDAEQLGGDWHNNCFELLAEFNDLSCFWLPRRCVVHQGADFVAEQPFFPDLQARLFRKDRRMAEPENQARQDQGASSLVLFDRWIERRDCAVPDENLALAPMTLPGALAARIAELEPPRSRRFVLYRPGDAIDFREGGNGSHYMIGPWGAPEEWGAWTLGGDAQLRLLLSAPVEAATLVATVQPFVHPRRPISHVEVLYGGELLDVWSFDNGDTVEKRVHVPARLIGRDWTPTFIFRTLNPTSPLELGISGDERVLGVGIARICLLAAEARGSQTGPAAG